MPVNTPNFYESGGFSPSSLQEIGVRIPGFLSVYVPKNPAKVEYFLPRTVSELLAEEKAMVKVLHPCGKWYGVTYVRKTQKT